MIGIDSPRSPWRVIEGAGIGGAVGGAVGAVGGAIAAIGTTVTLSPLGIVIAGPLVFALVGGAFGAGAGGLLGGLVGTQIRSPGER